MDDDNRKYLYDEYERVHSSHGRKDCICCEACQKCTGEVQKVAEIEGVCALLNYPHNPNTKDCETDKTRNEGDNDANKGLVKESTNNTTMRAADIAVFMDQYKISCPRCRYILHRAQKSVRQISMTDGLLYNNICKHCQAQIKGRRPLQKGQFIYSKLKSDSMLIRGRKGKELLRDTKITKPKHKDFSVFTKRQSTLIKIDPRMIPLIPSLKSLSEESLSGVELPVKKVSIKETVEVIQDRESYGSLFLDKYFLKKDFDFNFPRLVKKSEDIKGDEIRSSEELFKDTHARLQMQAEEKKKKNEEIKNIELEEKEKKKQASILKKEKNDMQRGRQRKDEVSGGKDKTIISESESSMFDERTHNFKKKGKGHVFQESKEDLIRSKKSRKSDEPTNQKKREKGQQDFKQETEIKAHEFKKESTREKDDKYGQGKLDKEKELPAAKKGLQAYGPTERKPVKEKTLAVPGKGLQDTGKEKEENKGTTKARKPDKEKDGKSENQKELAAPGNELQVPRKEKEPKSVKEKVLPAPRKGLQAPGKEEEKSYKDIALHTPQKEKELKLHKEKVLSLPGKGIQEPKTEKKEKSDKDQVLPAARKGREEKLGESKDEKSQQGKVTVKTKEKSYKEKKLHVVTEKEKEEKSDKDDVLQVPRKKKEEKISEAKDGKPNKEGTVSAPGVQEHGKEKPQKSNKEKTLPIPGKGTRAPEKEIKEKSDKDQVLPVSRKEREEKLGQVKDEKLNKKEDLPTLEKTALQAPGKKEDKSDKEKAVIAPGKKEKKTDKEKGLLLATRAEKEEKSEDDVMPVPRKKREEKIGVVKNGKPIKEEVPESGVQERGKEKDQRSDKEKTLPSPGKGILQSPGKIEEKSKKAKGLHEKEEKADAENVVPLEKVKMKDETIETVLTNVKTKNQISTADDVTLGSKVNKPKKGKEMVTEKELVDRKKQKVEQPKEEARNLLDNEKQNIEQKEKDIIDKSKIKITKPDDDLLINLMLQFEKKKVVRKVPTTIIIPPFPQIPERLTKKTDDQTDDWLQPEFDHNYVETDESSSIDEVVYVNKIIKKHDKILARGSSGTKERAADIVCNNIFKDEICIGKGDVFQTTKVPESEKEKEKDPSLEGVFRYALSDRTFIENGWTLLPIEKVVRKTNVYRMHPAHPEFNWFEHNKVKGVMHYDSGEKLAEFRDNGLGQWFYRNGRLALDYYDSKDMNAQQRIVIYSSGELDERGRSRPVTILGMFDYVGNGVIFDHSGKVRLKYNQTEGVLLDQEIGPASHWKWHSLNDPPVLQQVMIDTQMPHKDPRIARLGKGLDIEPRDSNKDMVAIEFENAIKEKTQRINEKFSPFQIKMKALKINENFSIRILDQASIYLLFRDGTTNLKLNLGMLLDSNEIVDTDTADLGVISTGLERLPAETESLEALQRSIKYAKHFERNRIEHDRRLRLPEPAASVDRINTLVSKPLKPPLAAVNYVTAISGECVRCYSKKPSICALYYNNRLN